MIGPRVLLLALCALAPAAHAGPADYVALPGVEYGEREIEFRYGTETKSGDLRLSAGSIAFGYGTTPWRFTELYATFERTGEQSMGFDAPSIPAARGPLTGSRRYSSSCRRCFAYSVASWLCRLGGACS